MSERELRTAAQPMEIRQDEGEAIRVSGYAAVFGEETNIGGMFTEVIDRGAFANALQRQDDVVFLVNHDGLPLARTRSGTLRLTEDERGLYMETELDGTDPDVRAIVPKMKRGDLDKMSFAFVPKRQDWDDSGEIPKRTIQDLELHDVAIVTTPAYDGTEIGLRSLEAHRADAKKSQAERRLRIAGRISQSARRLRMKGKL
jgi:HK97 family phage prohead protease